MIPEQGWQCPICKRVYNPRQEMCLYCGGGSVSSPVTPPKKIQDGISWTNGYCDNLGSTTHATNTITDSNWMTVTSSSCGEAISAVKASNNTVEINGLELKGLIENSVKEKLDETTVRASTN
jgi:hypothetical protein